MLNKKETLSLNNSLFDFVLYQNDKVFSRFTPPGKRFFIGKKKSYVFLNHPSVSMEHAFVDIDDEGGEIIDLNSIHGVFINDQRIQRGRFNIGDRLRIGAVELVVENIAQALHEVHATEQGKSVGVNFDESGARDISPFLSASGSGRLTLVPDIPPESNLTLVDGDYCDITFDESKFTPSSVIPFLEQDFSKKEYIDFAENDSDPGGIIDNKSTLSDEKNCAIEVTIALSGNVLSVNYLPVKNKNYFLGPVGKEEHTIGLSCMEGKKSIPFIKVSDGNIEVCVPPQFNGRYLSQEKNISGDVFDLSDGDVVSLDWRSIQIFIRHSDAPENLKSAPLFNERKGDRSYTTSAVFSGLMSLMLLTLLVDTSTIEQINKKEISVVYRPKPLPPVEEPKNLLQVVTQKALPKINVPSPPPAVKKNIVVKKVARVAKPPPPPPPPRKKKPPIKSYSFSAKGTLNTFFKTVKTAKSNKLVKNVSYKNKNSLITPRQVSGNRANLSRATARLGDNFKGKYDRSVGSKGLSKKRKIVTAYEAPIPKVVMGSMDPELLRRLLREHMPQFRHCYQQELLGNDRAEGKVDLKFRIIGKGRIKNVAVLGRQFKFSPSGKECMKNVLALIDFPAPKGGGVVDIKQPLNFSSTRVR